jgi:hypothetical protein
MCSAFINIDDDVDVSKACETAKENINVSTRESLGCYELKIHKPFFDEGCSKLLAEINQAKLQWLQHPSKIN